MHEPTHVVRFGVFELDIRSGELHRHGLKIRLPDQSFQILKVLLRRPGEVVTRDELRHVLWTSETFVNFEVGLNSAVRKLREALDDSAENPRFVETLPRRGYRFVASINPTEPDVATEAVPAVTTISAGPPPQQPAAFQTPPVMARSASPWIPARRAASLLLLALMVAGWVVYDRGDWKQRVGTEPIRAVVVFPFENLTGDPAQDHLVASVTDAVTMHLGHVRGLDVVSGTTARHYKDTAKRLPEIGRELPVDGVVSGKVGRSGTNIRITVQLSRAATDRIEWGNSYEGDLGQMLDLQRRMASDIAAAAGRPAALVRQTPHAVNPQAQAAYVKGLTAKGQQRYYGYITAVKYFEEAIAIQPDFGEAYAELAIVQVQFLFGGPFSPHEAMPKAESAARKALELDPTLPRAHQALGQVLSLYHWRWEEGELELRKAVESQALTSSLLRRGRFAEAIAVAEAARKLDPLSVNAQVSLGSAYCAAGQYDRALGELRRALEASPGNNRINFQLGITFVSMGRLDDGIRALELAARPSNVHNSRLEAYLGYAYAAAGRTADARGVLQELEAHRRDQYVSSFGIALIHDALGEKGPALAALERAAQERAVEFGQLAQYPPFTAIAAEPAFHGIMRQVGLPY